MATNILTKEMNPSLGMHAQMRTLPLGNLTEKSLDAAAEVSASCKPEPTWIFTGLGSEYSEKLVQAAMVCNEGVLNELDKPDEFHNMESLGAVVEPTVFPKNYLLSLELQALLDASVGALKDDASGQNTQKVLLSVLTQALRLAAMRTEATDAETQAVMLDVMERSAQFVEANVSVPQFNRKEATGVRTLVFNVYDRLAKVLGRNTPEAVRADLRAMLTANAERIKYTNPPGRKPKAVTTQPDSNARNGPDQHIEGTIQPALDEDMKCYAFDMSTYYIPEVPSWRSFYTVLGKWRAGHTPVKQRICSPPAQPKIASSSIAA